MKRLGGLCRLAQERISAYQRYLKSSLKRKWLVGEIWRENGNAVGIEKRNEKDEGDRRR